MLFTRGESNNIAAKLYDKRDAYGFHIVNFPYAHCHSNYGDFYHKALVTKLCHRVTKLIVGTAQNSVVDTRILLDNTKIVCEILADSSVKMSYIFADLP